MQLRQMMPTRQLEFEYVGDKKLVFIKDRRHLEKVLDYDFDGIVVDYASIIPEIRKSDDLYLYPLFSNQETEITTDGAYNPDQSNRLLNILNNIQSKLEPFLGINLPDDPKEKIIIKLIRYLDSRSLHLTPRNNRMSKIGFSFPIIENLSIENDPLQIMQLLNQYANKNYFQTVVQSKVNLCYDCNSGYLNFAESCTKCHSLDLKTENLIHHFRCAYIGPESDFVKGDQLVCPKCDTALKHIGIDYDKPSEIHICNNCNHTTQETTMMAKCVDCGKENELNQLTTHTIYEYRPTEKGRNKALESRPLFQRETPQALPNLQNAHPQMVFELLSGHEIQKQASYPNPLFFLDLSIDERILTTLHDQLRINLLDELCGIIKPYLKQYDLLTIISDSQIRVLLIDYPEELANKIEETITYNLNKMLRDNKWSNMSAIKANLKPVVQ